MEKLKGGTSFVNLSLFSFFFHLPLQLFVWNWKVGRVLLICCYFLFFYHLPLLLFVYSLQCSLFDLLWEIWVYSGTWENRKHLESGSILGVGRCWVRKIFVSWKDLDARFTSGSPHQPTHGSVMIPPYPLYSSIQATTVHFHKYKNKYKCTYKYSYEWWYVELCILKILQPEFLHIIKCFLIHHAAVQFSKRKMLTFLRYSYSFGCIFQ